VEEHERQRPSQPREGAEAVAGPEGHWRMLLSQTVDARGGAGAGAEAGGGTEPKEVSLESEEDTSEQDTNMQEERLLPCWERVPT